MANGDKQIIAGFWRRFFAFFIDSLILSIAGFVLGFIFFDYFVAIGTFGRLIGFAISLLYFGI